MYKTHAFPLILQAGDVRTRTEQSGIYSLKWIWQRIQQQNVRGKIVTWILEYFSHNLDFKERPVLAYLLTFSTLPLLGQGCVSF